MKKDLQKKEQNFIFYR